MKLFTDNSPQSKLFKKRIRSFNTAFSMSSIGADRKIFENGPYVFKICGVMHHRIGQLGHDENDNPKFAQIYIYDPQQQINYRKNLYGLHTDAEIEILKLIQKWVVQNNELAKKFFNAFELSKRQPIEDVKIILKGNIKPTNAHPGTYNLPTVDEIAVIIPGNMGMCSAHFTHYYKCINIYSQKIHNNDVI